MVSEGHIRPIGLTDGRRTKSRSREVEVVVMLDFGLNKEKRLGFLMSNPKSTIKNPKSMKLINPLRFVVEQTNQFAGFVVVCSDSRPGRTEPCMSLVATFLQRRLQGARLPRLGDERRRQCLDPGRLKHLANQLAKLV